MNVTITTTITTTVQQGSYTEGITAIAAFAALIVSVLTLWFTSLKGPDIVLCEKPKFPQEVPLTESYRTRSSTRAISSF